MRKKRIMVIGPRGCGKTSFVNVLNNYDGPLRKTQDTIYTDKTIDVPSAYIENVWMYKHMIALSQDASCMILMLDQSRCTEVYSHGFARAFRCPVIGVVTKADVSPENEDICKRQLGAIGVREPYFNINLQNKEGIEELENYLQCLTTTN